MQRCRLCGFVVSSEPIPMEPHNLKWETQKAATCEEEGVMYQQCQNPNCKKIMIHIQTEKLEHEEDAVTHKCVHCGKEMGQPTPDVNQPTPDENQPTPDENQPTPDENQPTPDENQPTPDVNQPTPDDNQPTPDDNQPDSDNTQENPDNTQQETPAE